MGQGKATELWLIRHAPALHGGALAGRRDVAADCADVAALAGMRAATAGLTRHVCSPALRCRQTALALWPGVTPAQDPRLWEQDFGAWEGVPFADLPDLGPLPAPDLAAHAPPGGESFNQLCARAAPALHLLAQGEAVAVVAHAGTIRAALALAIGSASAALAFQIAPLSLTRIVALPGGGWSVAEVNRVFA